MLLKNRRGFTLPELIVVAGIISLLSLFLAIMLSNSLKSYRFGQKAVRFQDTAAKGTREFENKARYAERIEEATPDTFTFKAYIANDKRPAPTLISFKLDPETKQLVRYITLPVEAEAGVYAWGEVPDETKVVVGGVQNTDIFSFYSDQNYNYDNDAATILSGDFDISQIKMVRINLTIDDDPAVTPTAIEESTLVSLRNLKSNL